MLSVRQLLRTWLKQCGCVCGKRHKLSFVMQEDCCRYRHGWPGEDEVSLWSSSCHLHMTVAPSNRKSRGTRTCRRHASLSHFFSGHFGMSSTPAELLSDNSYIWRLTLPDTGVNLPRCDLSVIHPYSTLERRMWTFFFRKNRYCKRSHAFRDFKPPSKGCTSLTLQEIY